MSKTKRFDSSGKSFLVKFSRKLGYSINLKNDLNHFS